MALEARYQDQVRLLMRVLPIVAEEEAFALKGGTAINLFVRDMPRLSVDIDLAYLSTEPRQQALPNARAALERIASAIEQRIPGTRAQRQTGREDELRVLVREGRNQIKVEVSPVLRGTVFEPEWRDVAPRVEDEFGFASIRVVSLPDLYGGKICAALDRQHPRDLFDVKLLLDAQELDRSVFMGFLAYLLGHSRPLNEVLNPLWKPLELVYEREFMGMLRDPVPLEALEAARGRLLSALSTQLTQQDAEFLLSFKRGVPDWGLLGVDGVRALPAVQWKLKNIERMGAVKRAEGLAALEKVLQRMLAH